MGMVNLDTMEYGGIVEAMRDFCGSFYDIKDAHYNNMLMYVLPDAVTKALEDEPERFGSVRSEYREILHDGFLELANKNGCEYPEYKSTENVIHDWITGKRKPKDFTPEEIAFLCDVFYINSVSVAVESAARKIIKSQYSNVLKIH